MSNLLLIRQYIRQSPRIAVPKLRNKSGTLCCNGTCALMCELLAYVPSGPYLEGGLGNSPPPYGWKKYFFAYKISQYSKFFAPAAPIGTAGEYSVSHFFADRSSYLKKFRRFLGKCCQKFTKNSLF